MENETASNRFAKALLPVSISAAAVIVSATQLYMQWDNNASQKALAQTRETLSYADDYRENYIESSFRNIYQIWLDNSLASGADRQKGMANDINRLAVFYSHFASCALAEACNWPIGCLMFFGDMQTFHRMHKEFLEERYSRAPTTRHIYFIEKFLERCDRKEVFFLWEEY